MPGRPRKTVAQLKLSGTFNKVSSRKDWNEEVPCVLGYISAPKRYLQRTKVAWNQFMRVKAQQGVLSEEDQSLVLIMFNHLDHYYRADDRLQQMEKDPAYFGTSIGLDAMDKIGKMIERHFNSFSKLALRFGMTPSERTKLHIPEHEKQSEMLQLLQEN